MKKYTLNKKSYYALGILFIFGLWAIISFFFDENGLIFPSFPSVFKETINILKGSYIYECLYQTLIRMIKGFLIALLIAIILGTISGRSTSFKYFINPLIVVLKTIPIATLVFFFLVLSGAKDTPIYIVVLLSFPILYESVVAGYENIDKTLNDMLKLDMGNELEKTISVRFPLVLPYLLVGIASSLGLSFKTEIMAEILTGSTKNGLGSMISYVQKTDPTNMTMIFAYSLIAIAISLIFDLILKLIKNRAEI